MTFSWITIFFCTEIAYHPISKGKVVVIHRRLVLQIHLWPAWLHCPGSSKICLPLPPKIFFKFLEQLSYIIWKTETQGIWGYQTNVYICQYICYIPPVSYMLHITYLLISNSCTHYSILYKNIYYITYAISCTLHILYDISYNMLHIIYSLNILYDMMHIL